MLMIQIGSFYNRNGHKGNSDYKSLSMIVNFVKQNFIVILFRISWQQISCISIFSTVFGLIMREGVIQFIV